MKKLFVLFFAFIMETLMFGVDRLAILLESKFTLGFAKVKYGEMIADMRGKINGTVHSKNTYGQYMRNKVTPVNPSTPSQAAVRSNFGSISQAWRSMTNAQRFAWEQSSANFSTTNIFGDSFKYTGFNLHSKINRWLYTIGEAYNATPPVPTAVTNSAISALVSDISDSTVEATFSPAIPVGTKVAVYATAPVSAGKSFVKSEYRKIATLQNGNASPFNLFTVYTTLFGPLTGKAGMKVFVKFLPITQTGVAGIESSQSAIITA